MLGNSNKADQIGIVRDVCAHDLYVYRGQENKGKAQEGFIPHCWASAVGVFSLSSLSLAFEFELLLLQFEWCFLFSASRFLSSFLHFRRFLLPAFSGVFCFLPLPAFEWCSAAFVGVDVGGGGGGGVEMATITQPKLRATICLLTERQILLHRVNAYLTACWHHAASNWYSSNFAAAVYRSITKPITPTAIGSAAWRLGAIEITAAGVSANRNMCLTR